MKASMTLKLSKRLSFGEEVANSVTHAVGAVACWYSCRLQLFTVITTMACRLLLGCQSLILVCF